MPRICSVPYCKGNYPTGPKVSVFSFPKRPNKKLEWLKAIQRKDFVPNQHSRVCELHFCNEDFIVTASAFDGKTGKVVSAPLQR
ncbi:hypothetical protein JTE90_026263 [Oedothorax gibbosus]|nr:hypothetical protein JTE90_026263 [Oedothorax gibbosus]